MSWRDRFLVGSFKGVEFRMDEHDATFARTIVIHGFPGSENHFSQDTGREPDGFAVRAFIVGENYDLERDRFLAACSSPGPGQLVHPYLGSRFVHCKSVVLRENRQELGIVRFDLVFIEAGENLFPAVEERRQSAVLSAVAKAREESERSFLENFNVRTGLDAIRSATAFLENQLQTFRSLEQEVNQIYAFDAAVTLAVESANELISAPSRLLGSVSEAFGRITGRTGNLYAIAALRRLGQGYRAAIGKAAADRTPITQLNLQLYKESIFTRAESLSRILEEPLDAEVIVPESQYREALKGVVEDVENTLDLLSSYIEFQTFSDLKGVLLSLSDSPDVYALPDLKTYIVPYDMPLSIVSFNIYGTTDRAADIQRLNEILDPLFIKENTRLSYING